MLLILLFLPSIALSYTAKDINLSKYSFNRYVRPQLINIAHDYQTLLIILNPELKSLSQFSKIFSALKTHSLKLQEKYKSKDFEGAEVELSKSIDKLAAGVKLLEKIPDLKNKKHFTTEDVLQSFSQFQEFKKYFYDLYILYQNTLFMVQAKVELPVPLHKIHNQLRTSYTQFNLLLLDTSDERFKKDFIAFWNDFINPVLNLILPHNDKKFFLVKLNDLNLRLNFLNVSLTKRNKKITKQTKTILKIIHRRWNNILKVTLKR